MILDWLIPILVLFLFFALYEAMHISWVADSALMNLDEVEADLARALVQLECERRSREELSDEEYEDLRLAIAAGVWRA